MIKVVAERFVFSAADIKVKRGTVIEFQLRSEDTNHGFHIVGSDANA